MAQNDDEDIPKDLSSQLVFGKWNVRFDALKKLKETLEKKTKDDPMYSDYSGRLAGFIKDSMDACSKAATILASSFSLYSFSPKEASAVTKAIVDKGILSSKQDMKATALNALLDFIEGGKAEYVQKALLSGLGGSVNNHIISCEDAICTCVLKFGATKSGLKSDEIVNGLAKLLIHQNQKVRDSCRLAISACVWAVPTTPLDNIIKALSDVQKKEFEKTIAEVKTRGHFRAERKTYEEQQAELFGSGGEIAEEEVEEKEEKEEKNEDEIDDSMKDMFEVDVYEPTDLVIPSNFTEIPNIKEWKVKNELLKTVLESVSNDSAKRFDIGDSNLASVARVLAKVISSENNVFCTTSALGIVSVLSRKLGKKGTSEFAQFTNNFIKTLLPPTISRFKDSNKTVVSALNTAIDSMFVRIMSLSGLIILSWGEGNDGTFMSDFISWKVEKNPKVRGRFLSSMIRAIQSNSKTKRPAILDFPERTGEDRAAEDAREQFFRRSISQNSRIIIPTTQSEAAPIVKFFDLLLLGTEDPDEENRNMSLTIIGLVIAQNKMLAVQQTENKGYELVVNTSNPMNNKIYKKFIEGIDKIKKDKIVEYIKEFGVSVIPIKLTEKKVQHQPAEDKKREDREQKESCPKAAEIIKEETGEPQKKVMKSQVVSTTKGVQRSKTATGTRRKAVEEELAAKGAESPVKQPTSSVESSATVEPKTVGPGRNKVPISSTTNTTNTTSGSVSQRSKSRGGLTRPRSNSSDKTPSSTSSVTLSTGRVQKKSHPTEFQLGIHPFTPPRADEDLICRSMEKHLRVASFNNGKDIICSSFLKDEAVTALKVIVEGCESVATTDRTASVYDSYGAVRTVVHEMESISEYVRTGVFLYNSSDVEFNGQAVSRWLESMKLTVSMNEVESQNVNVSPRFSINRDNHLKSFVNSISTLLTLFKKVSASDATSELASGMSKMMCDVIWYVLNPFVFVVRECEKGHQESSAAVSSNNNDTWLGFNLVFTKLSHSLEDILAAAFLALKTNSFSQNWEKLLTYIFGSCGFEFLINVVLSQNTCFGEMLDDERVDSVVILLKGLVRSLEQNALSAKGGFSYLYTCYLATKLCHFVAAHQMNSSLAEVYGVFVSFLKGVFGVSLFEFTEVYFGKKVDYEQLSASPYPLSDRSGSPQIVVLNPIPSENSPNERFECLPSPFILNPETLQPATTEIDDLCFSQAASHLVPVPPPSIEIVQEMQEATTNMMYGSTSTIKASPSATDLVVSSGSVSNIQLVLLNVNKLVVKKKQRLVGRILEILDEFTSNGMFCVDLYNTYLACATPAAGKTEGAACVSIEIDNTFPVDQEIVIVAPADDMMKTPSVTRDPHSLSGSDRHQVKINLSRLYLTLLRNILNWYRSENNTTITGKLLDILTKMVGLANHNHLPQFTQVTAIQQPHYVGELMAVVCGAILACAPHGGANGASLSASNMILNNMFGSKTGGGQGQTAAQTTFVEQLLVNCNAAKDSLLLFSPLYATQSLSSLDVESICQICNITVYNGVAPETFGELDQGDTPFDKAQMTYNGVLKLLISVIASSVASTNQDKERGTRMVPNNGLQQTTLMNIYKLLETKLSAVAKMLFLQQLKIQLLSTVEIQVVVGASTNTKTFAELIRPSTTNKELMKDILHLIRLLFIKYTETFSTQTNNLSAIFPPGTIRGLIKALLESAIYVVNYGAIHGYSERVDHVDQIVRRFLEGNVKVQPPLSQTDRKKLESFYEGIKASIFNSYKLKIDKIVEEFRKLQTEAPICTVELESVATVPVEAAGAKKQTIGTARRTNTTGQATGGTGTTQIATKETFHISRIGYETKLNFQIVVGQQTGSGDGAAGTAASPSESGIASACPATPGFPRQTETNTTAAVSQANEYPHNKMQGDVAGIYRHQSNEAGAMTVAATTLEERVPCNIDTVNRDDVVISIGVEQQSVQKVNNTQSIQHTQENKVVPASETETFSPAIKIPEYDLDELKLSPKLPKSISFLPKDLNEKLVILDAKTNLSVSVITTEANQVIDDTKAGSVVGMVQEIKRVSDILSPSAGELDALGVTGLVNGMKAILRLERKQPGLLRDCGFGITLFEGVGDEQEQEVVSVLDVCTAILTDRSLRRPSASTSESTPSVPLGLFSINKGLNLRVLKYCLLLLCTAVDHQSSELDGATASKILFMMFVFRYDWGLDPRACPTHQCSEPQVDELPIDEHNMAKQDGIGQVTSVDDLAKAVRDLGISLGGTNIVCVPESSKVDEKCEVKREDSSKGLCKDTTENQDKSKKMLKDCVDLMDVITSKLLNIKIREDITFNPTSGIGSSFSINSLLLLVSLAGKLNSLLLRIKLDELYDFITTQTEIPKLVDVCELFGFEGFEETVPESLRRTGKSGSDNRHSNGRTDVIRTTITPVSVVEYLRTQGMEETAYRCLDPTNYKFVDQLKQYIILGRTADDSTDIKRRDINEMQHLTRLEAILHDKIGLYKILKYIVHLGQLCLDGETFTREDTGGNGPWLFATLNRWCEEAYSASLANIDKYITRLNTLLEDSGSEGGSAASRSTISKIKSLQRLKTTDPSMWPPEVVGKFAKVIGAKTGDYNVVKNVMKLFAVLAEQRSSFNAELMYVESVKRKVSDMFKDDKAHYERMEANVNYPLPIANENHSSEEYNEYCVNGIYSMIKMIARQIAERVDSGKFVFLLKTVPSKSIFRQTLKNMKGKQTIAQMQEEGDARGDNKDGDVKEREIDEMATPPAPIETYTTVTVDTREVMRLIDLISGNGVAAQASKEEKKVVSDGAAKDLTELLMTSVRNTLNVSALEEVKFEEFVNTVVTDRIEDTRYPEILVKFIRGSVMSRFRHLI